MQDICTHIKWCALWMDLTCSIKNIKMSSLYKRIHWKFVFTLTDGKKVRIQIFRYFVEKIIEMKVICQQ